MSKPSALDKVIAQLEQERLVIEHALAKLRQQQVDKKPATK